MDPRSPRGSPSDMDGSLEEYLSHPDHLRQIVDALPAALVAVSPEGELSPLNKAARDIAGDLPSEGDEIEPGWIRLEPPRRRDSNPVARIPGIFFNPACVSTYSRVLSLYAAMKLPGALRITLQVPMAPSYSTVWRPISFIAMARSIFALTIVYQLTITQTSATSSRITYPRTTTASS